MSIQVNPIFDKPLRHDLDPFAGVPAFNEIATLDRIAAERGIRPLGDFDAFAHVKVPPGFQGDPDELTVGQHPQWYDPAEGVKALDALIAAVRDHPRGFKAEPAEDVLRSLESMRAALAAAVEQGTRFHFAAF